MSDEFYDSIDLGADGEAYANDVWDCLEYLLMFLYYFWKGAP